MPFSSGIILDNADYDVVKTTFTFAPTYESFVNNINATDTLDWLFPDKKYDLGALKDYKPESLKDTVTKEQLRESRSKKVSKSLGKKNKKKKGKLKKCFFKVFKKGKKHKKMMMPLIIGLLAAKSLLIPIALKALAFISAKGLMMGFFSTILASFLSLKGMFDHSHGWNRRDDTKTQVEIIQVPSRSDEHLYYDHYKRGDRIPVRPIK